MSDRHGPGGPIPRETARLLGGRIVGDVTAPEFKEIISFQKVGELQFQEYSQVCKSICSPNWIFSPASRELIGLAAEENDLSFVKMDDDGIVGSLTELL